MPALRLQDGRTIGYELWGPEDGTPVFYLHSSAGSRLESCWDVELLEALEVRLITRNARVTASLLHIHSPDTERALTTWRSISHLNLEAVSIVGFSCAGSHALAFARWFPHRTNHVGIVASVRPYSTLADTAGMSDTNRQLFEMAINNPAELRAIAAKISTDVPSIYDLLTAEVSHKDKTIFKDPEFRKCFLRNMEESFCQAGLGAATDYLLMSQPWGFLLQDITADVMVLHGSEDSTVPPSHGRYVAESLPNGHFTLLPGRGHFFLSRAWREVLEALMAGRW